MRLQKETNTFFWCAVIFLAMIFFVAALLLVVLFTDIKGWANWLSTYGGLIGSIFAVIIASYTIKRQSDNVREQIQSQRSLEEARLIREKIEEMYSVVSKLRLKILFARAKFHRDIISDIDIFNYDLDKILMLYNLYGNYNLYASIDKCLFSEYRGSVSGLLDNWREVAQKAINVISNQKEDVEACLDADKAYKKSFERFEKATDNFIIHLSSIGKNGNINIIRSVE